MSDVGGAFSGDRSPAAAATAWAIRVGGPFHVWSVSSGHATASRSPGSSSVILVRSGVDSGEPGVNRRLAHRAGELLRVRA